MKGHSFYILILPILLAACSSTRPFKYAAVAPKVLTDVQVKRHLKLPDNYLINMEDGKLKPTETVQRYPGQVSTMITYSDPNKNQGGAAFLLWTPDGLKTLWTKSFGGPVTTKYLGDVAGNKLQVISSDNGYENEFLELKEKGPASFGTPILGKTEFNDIDGDGVPEAIVSGPRFTQSLDSKQVNFLNKTYGLKVELTSDGNLKDQEIYTFGGMAWTKTGETRDSFIDKKIVELQAQLLTELKGAGTSKKVVAFSGCSTGSGVALKAYRSLIALHAAKGDYAGARKAYSSAVNIIGPLLSERNHAGDASASLCLKGAQVQLLEASNQYGKKDQSSSAKPKS